MTLLKEKLGARQKDWGQKYEDFIFLSPKLRAPTMALRAFFPPRWWPALTFKLRSGVQLQCAAAIRAEEEAAANVLTLEEDAGILGGLARGRVTEAS